MSRLLGIIIIIINLRCHVLLVNQMRCRIYQMQELINVSRPVRQDRFWIGGRTKAHNVGRTVDFRINTAITDHSRNLLLQLGTLELQELGQPRSMNALVIHRSDTNIVLNDASKEDFFPMRSQVSFRKNRARFEFLLLWSGIMDDFCFQE